MKETTPEKKSVKTLKGQLFGAVSMMLVAAIALGTSTYAWFINNRTVEVQNMQLTVSTSTALLVAVGKKASVATATTAYAANNYTTFKTVVMNQDITGKKPDGAAADDAANWDDFLTTQMTPASVTSDSLKQVGAFPSFYMSLDKLTDGKVSDFQLLKAGGNDTTKADVGQGPVKSIRFAFQASSDLDVYFGRAASADNTVPALASVADMITPYHTKTQAQIDALPVGEQAAANAVYAEETAQAAAIKAALKMAIVPRDTTTVTNTAPTILQFDDGTSAFLGSVNNTYYKDAAIGANDPDGLIHDTNFTATDTETTGVYAAAAGVDATSKHINMVKTLSAMVPGDDAVTTNDPDKVVIVSVDNAGVVTTTVNNLPMFQLKAEEARVVDVYFWLEGTDKDCINALSAYKFNLTLPFAAIETPTT